MTVLRGLLGLVVCLGLAGTAAAAEIGSQVENLRFKDIRYLVRSLSDLGEVKGYALVFLNTDCPIAQRYLPKLKELDAKYGVEGIQFVGVYCSDSDTINDMASHALENQLRFHVVKDEDHSVCNALGIERVPQVALLDSQRKLVYRGRINDQYRSGGTQPQANREDLAAAIDELLAGQPVSVAETPVDGCKVTPPREPKFDRPITYHDDIAAIMQARCQNCHHEGTPAPFSLTSYDDVSLHAETVADVVRDGRMPPWYASPKYGHFDNAPGMTQDERDKVLAWVAAGCPEGDATQGPAPLEFADTKWRIGEPDLVITMKKPHQVQAEGIIPYNYVILPYSFAEDTYVNAIEILPHNRNVVHHCNMAYVNVGQMKAGRETFITGYVPGGQPMDLRSKTPDEPGVAVKIPARSSLVLQIHYTVTGKPEESVISVGFKYAGPKVDKVTHFCVLDPRGFGIAPHDPMFKLEGRHVVPRDATLLGMFTHMHVRGRDMTFFAHKPDGTTETLLQIPNFNFEWQLGYECKNKIPAGTELHAVGHYDNSRFNVYNPDPTREVPYGDQTFDEMFNGFVFWVYDDENLNLTVDPKTGRAVEGPADKVTQQ